MENSKSNGYFCPCVGYGFVPYQEFDKTYMPEKAIAAGTIFPELSMTIDEYGKVCRQEGEH